MDADRSADDAHLFEDDPEPITGYCMHCRESVEMDDPLPVWTRRGMPATRGECPVCGGTVFRMGKSDAHRHSERPDAVFVAPNKRKRPKLPPNTVYVNYAVADAPIAQQIADDLQKIGVMVWLHEHDSETDLIKWAGGVHPALKECNRMVYVQSSASLTAPKVEAAWRFFKGKRKPIVIAQITDSAPPDAIRRSPRFDFSQDYKTAFRQMVQALSP